MFLNINLTSFLVTKIENIYMPWLKKAKTNKRNFLFALYSQCELFYYMYLFLYT